MSRKEGRRVPRELAVARPSQKELLEVAAALGLEAKPLEGKYPREWWNKEGPVLVEKRGSKREVITLLAKELRRRRYGK
ncbi:TPA: signal recognition particle protein Srp19 [Desulfurococcaceae archaeon]|nr:signal recognition particle protein Srp19 [Desulfurococcaceae archaeon]